MRKQRARDCQFQVVSGEHLTMRELLYAYNQGIAVYRSSHIGNQYWSNLMLAAAGVPIQYYDRTTVGVDRNYHPDYLISNGEKQLLTQNVGRFIPFAKFKQGISIPTNLPKSGTPACLHMQSLAQVFPQLAIGTASGLCLTEKVFLSRIIGHLFEIRPQWFERFIAPHGRVAGMKVHGTLVPEYVSCLDEMIFHSLGCMPLSDCAVGIAPKIEASTLIRSIISYLKAPGGDAIVYEVSGPDFVRYALCDEFKSELNVAYQYIAASISNLPRELTLVIVPSFYFRFGGLQCEMFIVDQLVQDVFDFRALRIQKRAEIKKLPKGDHDIRRQVSQRFDSEMLAIASRFVRNSVLNRMMYNLHEASFFTQYDLLQLGESIYIPARILDIEACELEQLYNEFEHIQRYIKRL